MKSQFYIKSFTVFLKVFKEANVEREGGSLFHERGAHAENDFLAVALSLSLGKESAFVDADRSRWRLGRRFTGKSSSLR